MSPPGWKLMGHLATGSSARSDLLARTCETGCGGSEHGASATNDREPPPTHLADVLGGFLIDSREGSGLKQLECSTKKLMLSKTKLSEDIPGGSSSESVPTSDELDHGALIADPTRFYGPVAVTGTPPGRAAIVLLLHRRLPFPDRNRRHPARGCWLHPPPVGDGFTVGFVQSFGGTLSRCAQRNPHCPARPVAGPGIVVDMRRDASGTCCAGRAILYAAWLSGKTVGETIWFTVSAPMFHRSGDHRSRGEPNAASCRARSRPRKWRAMSRHGHKARLPSVSPPPRDRRHVGTAADFPRRTVRGVRVLQAQRTTARRRVGPSRTAPPN